MTNKEKILKWTAIAIFIGLAAWGLKAESAEVGIGLSHAVSHESKWIGQHMYLSDRDWYIEATKYGGEDRLPDTWRYTAGFRVDWRPDTRIEPYLKIGVAYFEDKPVWVISDHWAYDMSMGMRFFGVLDLEYNHNSTGGRSDHNKGNDLINLYLIKEFN